MFEIQFAFMISYNNELVYLYTLIKMKILMFLRDSLTVHYHILYPTRIHTITGTS